jgi:thermostable 8-oxoguanine DNA glycosylase
MATVEQEKHNRKRKFVELDIENEDEKNNILSKNDNIHIHTTRSDHSLQTKLEVCIYSEQSKITCSWRIVKYFEHKYPTLREDRVKEWIKLGSTHFETLIDSKGSQTKRIRNQRGHFELLESMLVKEIIEREKIGAVRDKEWTRKRAYELYIQYKDEFGWKQDFNASN